jgi:hypothetical protein
MSVAYHYLNEEFSTVARAAVRARPLTHRLGASYLTIYDPYRSLNLERHPLCQIMMPTATFHLGCSFHKTQDPVLRHRPIIRSLAS